MCATAITDGDGAAGCVVCGAKFLIRFGSTDTSVTKTLFGCCIAGVRARHGVTAGVSYCATCDTRTGWCGALTHASGHVTDPVVGAASTVHGDCVTAVIDEALLTAVEI